MKIDNRRPDFEPDATRRSERVTGGGSAAPRARSAAPGDRVELSPHAALAAAAIRSVDAVPDVRVDRIEQVQAKLGEGQMADSETIADRLIDDLLGTS